MIQKIIVCKSLDNSQENVIDGGYFRQVANVQRTEFNCTINRLNVPKNSCLKNNILRKKAYGVPVLIPCCAQPAILQKRA